jgi:hypothetical protein
MLGHGTNVVSDGLVFYSDMSDTVRSYMGGPTTNYAYDQNPRIDSSYSQFVYTASGTWPVNHSSAITVYNDAGTDISSYVNTGVTDWTNTYHAVWTYDSVLKRPVVTMRDVDGAWKAKAWTLPGSFSSWGLSNGSQYTISWLSWTDDLTKCANAGIYRYSTASGTSSFWDGQSNSQSTAFNTQLKTWQRVYATFTVSSSADIGSSISCYMYGYYGNRGTVKVADVQIEPLAYPTSFSKTLTRTSSQVLLDMAENHTVTTYGELDYGSNYISTGTTANTTKYMTINPTGINGLTSWTVDFWLQRNVANGVDAIMSCGAANDFLWYTQNSNTTLRFQNGVSESSVNYPVTNGEIYNFTATGSGGTITVYKNGVSMGTMTNTTTFNVPYVGGIVLGQEIDNNTTGGFQANQAFLGRYYNIKIYNRVLSGDEVLRNFNALRVRYGV